MNLGDRMKEYELCSKSYLIRRNPVVIRIDGKAFHTFTKGMEKPFDPILSRSMIETCKFLCENIMNCKLAYTQSDEISLLLVDYERLETEAWFSNNIQKMSSVSASMATLAFNRAFIALGGDTYPSKRDGAMFDSRVFSVPKEDVCNYFVWRQQDATKNSISSIAQSMFSHKELHGKNGDQKQEMIFQKSGENWNNYPAYQKRGSCVVKEHYSLNGATRTRWVEDAETPIFSKNREYIEKHVIVE